MKVEVSGLNSFPLSRAQQALWLAQQVNPSTPFVVAQYVELRGLIDVSALIEATDRGAARLNLRWSAWSRRMQHPPGC